MNIVGYKSPFKKKESPLKAPQLIAAQIGIAAAPGILSAVGSLFGRRKRRREQQKAREEMKKAREAFEAIEYTNPYENLTNPYAGMQNPFAENIYEDLTVDTQAADFAREQQQQSQADLLANLRGAAGGSGVAALAQSLSNVATQQARQASLQISQQERRNELARLRGEEQKRRGAFGVEKMQRAADFQIDQLQARGEAMRKAQEDARTQALYGLNIRRADAADAARQQARSQLFSGIGQAAAGVAGLYAPGGALVDTLSRKTFEPIPVGLLDEKRRRDLANYKVSVDDPLKVNDLGFDIDTSSFTLNR